MIESTENRIDFEVLKSSMCHKVKDMGDCDFIIITLQSDDIRGYWEKKQYPEAFYLLAMLDYLSRINEIPLYSKYDDIRKYSLQYTLYPRDVMLALKLNSQLDVREVSQKKAIAEFLQYNIVETDVRNVY